MLQQITTLKIQKIPNYTKKSKEEVMHTKFYPIQLVKRIKTSLNLKQLYMNKKVKLFNFRRKSKDYKLIPHLKKKFIESRLKNYQILLLIGKLNIKILKLMQ